MEKLQQSSGSYDYLFKTLLVGDSSVGKTSILLRFVDNKWEETFTPTIGVDLKTQTIKIDGKSARLQMWDTAGQEKFRYICNGYYRGAHGIMYTYDVSDRESFRQIEAWIIDSMRLAGLHIKKIIVANKCDLSDEQRMVTEQEGRELAQKLGIPYIETSAKENKNIDDAFEILVRKMIDQFVEDHEGMEYQNGVLLNSKVTKDWKCKKFNCCSK